MNTSPQKLLCSLCLFAAGGLPECAQAGPLPPADYRVSARGGTTLFGSEFGQQGLMGNVPLNLNLDLAGQYFGFVGSTYGPLFSYDVQTQAEAFGGPRPQAIATAEAHGSLVLASGGVFEGSASASLDYFVQLVPRSGAPANVFVVPVRISILMDVTGNASASVQIDSVRYSHSILSGHESEDLNYLTNFPVGQTSRVELRASAKAVENFGIGPPRPHSSQAVADPLFAFDQAAFDARMGPNTFPLADYYSFEYSPGAELVPEPTAIALALAGLGCLSFRRPPRDGTPACKHSPCRKA